MTTHDRETRIRVLDERLAEAHGEPPPDAVGSPARPRELANQVGPIAAFAIGVWLVPVIAAIMDWWSR